MVTGIAGLEWSGRFAPTTPSRPSRQPMSFCSGDFCGRSARLDEDPLCSHRDHSSSRHECARPTHWECSEQAAAASAMRQSTALRLARTSDRIRPVPVIRSIREIATSMPSSKVQRHSSTVARRCYCPKSRSGPCVTCRRADALRTSAVRSAELGPPTQAAVALLRFHPTSFRPTAQPHRSENCGLAQSPEANPCASASNTTRIRREV
jgi:hypothetical protein